MSTDARTGRLVVDGQTISRVETPATFDELRDAVGGHASLLIAGNGSRLTFGNRGGPFDSAVSLRRLNRVIHYEPEDLTVAVEPGITVAELNAVLGARGQMLPIDDSQPESSTLGGTYANGLGGPRRLGYGSLRDWVLGVEVMAPDGVVTKSGGMVVKNVTGYDLPRLHFGAHGAFGIITRLNLKVVPLPEASRSVVASYNTADDAHRAGRAVLSSQLEPKSVLVSNHPHWQISVCCEGASASIQRQVDDIVHIATSVATSIEVRVTEDVHTAIEPFCAITRLDGSLAVARLAVPPSRQLEVLERYQGIAQTRVCADLGSGVVHVAGIPSMEWREMLRQTSERPVFLALPPELKGGVEVFGGMDASSARLVTSLKDAFDPDRRLNHGRFVLGL